MSPFSSPSIQQFAKSVFGLIDRAVAEETPGRIRYGGTTWFARPSPSCLDLTFAEGEWVSIVARQGNTLLIRPIVKQPIKA